MRKKLLSIYLTSFKIFLKFLWQKKIVGLSLLLVFLFLLLFFGQSPKTSLPINSQAKKIESAHFSPAELTKLPRNFTGNQPPSLTARSTLVIDFDSGAVIYEKNARSTHLPASTTKIMTALVAFDNFKLDQVLTVPELTYEGQDIRLRYGEQMTFESLLYGLLVASANDVAETLAANYPEGRAAFIAAMNKKAADLLLVNTHFVNPTGFDEPGQYTTAFDLARLSKTLLANPFLATVVATQKISIYNLDQTIVHPISNLNELLGKVEGLKGIKTGWTDNANECLATYVERDKGKIITIVLGSEDRFGESKKLIDWVYNNFVWEVPNL